MEVKDLYNWAIKNFMAVFKNFIAIVININFIIIKEHS